MTNPKILVWDLEVAPSLVYCYQYFKTNISPKQVVENPYILSFAGKWLGEDEIFYEENRDNNDKALVEKICYYLDQSDFSICHFGSRFDLPQVMGRAAVHGLKPPSVSKMIDTCKIARKEFNFPSNSLEYLCEAFSCKHKKSDHAKFAGFTLWKEVLKNNPEAWAANKEYNIGDVLSLEDLYMKMRPYITNHPNLANFIDPQEPVCVKCLSNDIQWRGYAHTAVGKYHRFQCNACGGWARTRYSVNAANKKLLTNA